MTSLCASNIRELEARLSRSRESILERVREHLHGSSDSGELTLVNHSEEVDDRAIADAMNDTDIAVITHELLELRAIDAALQRIDAGTYGVCVRCEEAIPAERLMAQPSAQYCIGCQQEHETGHPAAHPALL